MAIVEQSDILGTLKGGLGLASKLAGKGINEVTGMVKKGGEETSHQGQSGVYWQRGPWSNDNDLVPGMDYMEPQDLGRFKVSIVKRVTTSKAMRSFIQACGCCVSNNRPAMETYLQETVTSDPQFTDGYFLLGCLYLEGDDASQAVTNFQKALLCQQGLGTKLKKQLPSFRMSLPLTPSSAICLYADLLGVSVLLALSQRKAGNLNDALATMQQLLGVMPTEPLALFFTGILRLELGQFSQLVDELHDVLPTSTLQVANIMLLGYACSRMGDVSTAREIYHGALDKDDYDPLMRLDLQYAVGKCMCLGQSAGDTPEMRSVMQECPSYQYFFERLGVAVDGVSPKAKAGNGASNGAVVIGGVSVSESSPLCGGGASAASPAPAAVGVSPYSAPAAPANVASAPAPSAAVDAHLTPEQAAPPLLPPGVVLPDNSVAAPAASAMAVPLPYVATSGVSVPAPSTGAPPQGLPTTEIDTKLTTAHLSQADGLSQPAAGALAGQAAGGATPQSDSQVLNVTPGKHTVDPLPPRVEGQLSLVCPERGLQFILGSEPFLVGREEGTCILAGDSSVSRQHARITFEQGRYLVEDLRSTNGTWLNGYRLGPYKYELNRGDVVQFGLTKFRMV